MNYLEDLEYINNLKNVAVFGASGAIGSAFISILEQGDSIVNIYAFSRKEYSPSTHLTKYVQFDIENEDSLLDAKKNIPSDIKFDLIIIATGALHLENHMPEKALSQYTTQNAQLFYLINTIGPSLIIKHFWSLLSKENNPIIATLCARIGSIEDNKLGGWYSYRSSKAAMCMMIKSASIEIARRNPNAICVGLHPGTVESPLSEPFHKHIDPAKIMTPNQSTEMLLKTLSTLKTTQSGFQFAYDGSQIPF